MVDDAASFFMAAEAFLDAVAFEVGRASAKFPAPNPTSAALTVEVGELAREMLQYREGKHADWGRVYREAVQVAAMALRCAIEGDATIGAVPAKEGLA